MPIRLLAMLIRSGLVAAIPCVGMLLAACASAQSPGHTSTPSADAYARSSAAESNADPRTASAEDEADRLYALLDADNLSKKVLAGGFAEFSDPAKNELADRLAQAYAPAPRGAVLARLPLIRTAKNETALRMILVSNLRSPMADARKFSLLGLQELKYDRLTDFALASLRDENDDVRGVAIQILLPSVQSDAALRAYLVGFHAEHKGQSEYRLSVSLLEAHGLSS